jgi:hypothetical protein
MLCPKCLRSEYVIPIGDTHYLCKGESAISQRETGCGSQFEFVEDKKIRFPHSAIFMERGKKEFFRKPFLQVD